VRGSILARRSSAYRDPDGDKPPLWGLGLLPIVSSPVGLMHDGRARSAEEAILWHGGEADGSRQRFMALPRTKREALLQFLSTL